MIYVACRPANGTHVVGRVPDEPAEVAWSASPELGELTPSGVFDRSLRTCSAS